MIIGLYSSVPQSGKSTVASHLTNSQSFTSYPFAETMKKMVSSLLNDLGWDFNDIANALYYSDKSMKVYGDKTLRYALQTLGTDWGRKYMGDDFWVHVWSVRAARFQEWSKDFDLKIRDIVTDDMRFPNEYQAVKDLGGQVWRITRPGHTSPTNGHSSEGALDSHKFDVEIVNDGTIEDLFSKVDKALKNAK